MEPRIILSQADFSANNIGRYVELSELTKKVLAKQTQYEEGSDESIALNTFFENLTNDGFIGGENPILKNLLIPALASTHDEFLYDIATLDSDGYPTDLMNSLEKNATVEQQFFEAYTLNDRIVGVQGKIGGGSVTDTYTKRAITTNILKETNVDYNYTIVLFNANNLSDANNITLLSNNADNYVVEIGNNDNKLYWLNQPSRATISTPISPRYTNGFYVSRFNNNIIETDVDTGTVGELSVIGDSINKLKTQIGSDKFKLSGGANYNVLNPAFSFISFAEYMNDNKLAELTAHVNTLMSNLHVKDNA